VSEGREGRIVWIQDDKDVMAANLNAKGEISN
jgi:hypothetical protein